jgi:hypothetical protein
MALVTTPNTDVTSLDKWSNFHTTIPIRKVPSYCTPLTSNIGTHGASIKEILTHCFSEKVRARAIGARWSLSRVVEPESIIIDTANLEHVSRISDAWLTDEYKASRGKLGFVPMFVQGGVTMASLNQRFAPLNLALQTSGASDGHRVAGCIATGTHGAAVRVGAVHDTVLGFHVVIAPDRALFVQPEARVCTDDVPNALGAQLGITTIPLADDDLFRALQVSLGSLGFVAGVIVETAPLYSLHRKVVLTKWEDDNVWKALLSLDTSAFGIQNPYHVQTIFHPYDTSAFAIVMENGAALPPIPSTAAAPMKSADLMNFIGKLVGERQPRRGPDHNALRPRDHLEAARRHLSADGRSETSR